MSVLIPILFASVVTWRVVESKKSNLNSIVSGQADQLMAKMVERVTLYQYGLRGARAFVLSQETSVGLTRSGFYNYSVTRDNAIEFPGARGFGFVRRVPSTEVAQFLQRAQADNFPDFAIRQLQPYDEEHYIIQYIEPVDDNRAAVGLDIASEHHRRTAAQRAIETGEAQLTAPITLVQATGSPQQSFLLLMPVYRSWVTPLAPADRWQEAIGWTYAPLLMKEILGSVKVNSEHFRLQLSDTTDSTNVDVFYALNEGSSFVGEQRRSATVFGRTWTLELSGTPQLSKSLYALHPAMVFAISVGAGAVVCVLIIMLLSYWRARSVLFQQRSRLASFVEGSSDAIIGIDSNGSIRSWNRGAKETFGFDVEEVLGKQVAGLLVPIRLETEDLRLLQQLREGKRVVNFVTHRQRKDGDEFDALISVEPVCDDKQQVIGGSLTVRDISPIKRAEQDLAALNSKLEEQVESRTQELSSSLAQNQSLLEIRNSILTSSPLAIIATDNEGLITLFNPAAEQMLGYSAEETVGLHTLAIFHDVNEVISRAKEFSEELGENIAPGFDVFVVKSHYNLPNENEWTYIHKNQSRIPVLLSVSTLSDSQGKINGYLCMAANISQQQLDKKNLIDARNAADTANNAKSQFLANMSHEIRTPMNGVLGMLSLIKRTPLSNQQSDYLAKADSAARSLLEILNDILDFSKISAGQMVLDPTEFDLESLLAELGVILAGNLNEKPVEVVLDLDWQLPHLVIADRLRLLQVLINLAGNALKFTEIGHVIVRLSLLQKSIDSIDMRVEVEDTGIGMSEQQQAQLFQSFAQAEASTTRRYGGTGLGLVISKRLLELMGSELKLISALNTGSRFWFDLTLPYQANYVNAASDLVETISRYKVLVVDDSLLMADLLHEGLTQKGWRVVKVYSVTAALEAIENSYQSGEPFDVVLMDWNMPFINGTEACRRIRLPELPLIIMITAHEREMLSEVEQKDHQLFDELIVKPATITKVHKQLLTCLLGEEPVSTLDNTQASAAVPLLEGVKILVVEDNELNQQVALELLTQAGAIVSLASCGLEGVEKAMSQNHSFDLVLMDIQMPDIDGLEATRRIRAHRSLAQLPIVAITANASDSDRAACIEAGMNDHIGKPFDMHKLVPLIRHYTGLERAGELSRESMLHNNRKKLDSLTLN
ncbi:response regulator [Alteromonas pelagimontana]|uniref:Sensory/regulatory protein RpfC n=1 Tax=Alteromonas pelagimontana TaxID=1858656 RepID=A0A6M4MC99_9ALTE|nr:CHASE domain-containing protein [Alteromonas pelagimontana]QJR79776.1 response regulator [Alteromonas pelagimontana]